MSLIHIQYKVKSRKERGDFLDLSNVEILLVEDNPAETRLITEVFSEFEFNVSMNTVKDGISAMDYLYRRGNYEDSEAPSLIILDLNLPKKNGREVLKEIKLDKNLKCIPVIILTTSNDDNDITESYNNYANAYMTKPADFDKFKEIIQTFKDFWINKATLPRKD